MVWNGNVLCVKKLLNKVVLACAPRDLDVELYLNLNISIWPDGSNEYFLQHINKHMYMFVVV